MELQTGLKRILKNGAINDEIEYERALIIDRQLRLMVKEFPDLAEDRRQLRLVIRAYEDKHWVGNDITDKQVEESDHAEKFAEEERIFLTKRKEIIKSKLKEAGLTQRDLGIILGHSSVTYMSELINGINPFTLNDLIIIHHLLTIELGDLVPTMLSQLARVRVLASIKKLNNPKFKLAI